MKQFNLEEYKTLVAEGKEPRIVTREGNSARIVCTDFISRGGYLIVAAKKINDADELVITNYSNGRYLADDTDSSNDLFFADLNPEPKYRPYKDMEECFKDVVKHGGWIKNTSGQYLHVLAVTDGVMTYSGNISFPFERACRYWVWADDGSPCGVKEE